MNLPVIKQCSKCHEYKGAPDFMGAGTKDGLAKMCRACHPAGTRRRARHPKKEIPEPRIVESTAEWWARIK